MKTYQNELNFAKELALKAGDIILSYFSVAKKLVKSDFTPVTEADLLISRLVNSEVKKHFPHHKVLDEEKINNNFKSEYLWVCDPIDGTVPFANHIPTSMFSLALCKNNKPVVAVIYDPYMKRLLYSCENDNSCLNNQIIHVNDKSLTAGDTIYYIPFWLENFNHQRFLKTCAKKKLIVSAVESVVYLSMLVATGAIKAAIMPGAYPWDRAAAKLIVENAGGICSNENSNPITVFNDPKFFIATNKITNPEVISMVKKCLL